MAAHDRIEKDLESRLLESSIYYDSVDTCIDFKVRGRPGECDVIAIKGKYAVLIEIKGRDHKKGRKYAQVQLKRDIEWVHTKYPQVERIFPLYTYTDKTDRRYSVDWYDNLV